MRFLGTQEAIMAEEKPQSRPEPPESQSKPTDPKSGGSVYGGQWGQSGKQNPEDPERADPRSQPKTTPIPPPS
jgi:hypothetical protein